MPVVELAELVAGGDVFDGGGLVFAGKEVVAPWMEETFADVFESVGKSPANADGFFCKAKRRVVDDPSHLIWKEDRREVIIAIDGEGRENEHGI